MKLVAGQYLEIRLEQPSIDVDARLIGPDGAVIASADDPEGIDPERLALIAPVAGEHRLTVSPHGKAAGPGRYRVELRVLRPAGPGDTERAAAARAFAGGRRQAAAGRAGPPAQLEASERRALASFEKARGLWRTARDPEGEAGALLEIGDLRIALARPDEDPDAAVAAYEAAAALCRRLGDDRRMGRALYSLGYLRLNYHQTTEALALLNQAFLLRYRAGDRVGAARTLVALYGVYYGQGDIARAFDLLRRAATLIGSGGDPVLAAAIHQGLGRIHKLRGQPWTALEEFQEAMALLGTTEPKARYTSLQTVGTAYLDLGDADQALTYYRQSLVLAKSLGDPTLEAGAHGRIGWALRAQGRGEQALAEYGRAAELLRRRPAPEVETWVLRFLGLTETELNRPQEALAPLRKVLELRRTQGSLEQLARAHLELGSVLRDLRRAGEAAGHFQAAFSLARQVEGADLQAACLYQWARLERQQGRLAEALKKIRQSLAIVESVRSNVTDQGLRTSFFASKRDYYELSIDLLLQLHQRQPRAGYQRQAFEASEHARARGLLDLLSELRVDLRRGSSSGLFRRESDLEDRRAWLGEQLRLGSPGSDLASLRRDLAATEEALASLREEIRKSDPVYAEARYPKPLALPEVQRLLDDETLLLQYFLGNHEAFLFVVTREGVGSHRLGSPEVLRRQVSALRSVLRGEETTFSFQRYLWLGTDLYGRLLAPAQSMLARKSRLLIAPDDALYLLPFEALPITVRSRSYAGMHYLLEACDEVTYLPSASVLAGLRALQAKAARTAAASLVAFAYPVGRAEARGEPGWAAGTPGSPLPALPFSRDEVEGIARLFPRDHVVLRIGPTATEEAAKRLLRRGGQRVHFATHGFVDERQPWRSGLQLAGDARNDGRLQVDEIFGMKMSCDLLVLSACSTGLGKQVRGEGLIGLTRAFLHAGARSIVASLWRVPDQSTAELMIDFYRHLGSSETKAQALRQAKLDMIRKGGRFTAPRRWAPFVLVGEPR